MIGQGTGTDGGVGAGPGVGRVSAALAEVSLQRSSHCSSSKSSAMGVGPLVSAVKGGAGVGDKGLFSRHLDFGALFVCLFESRYIFDQIL